MAGVWGLELRERALDLLLPRICLGCREDLPPPLAGPLCGPCLGRLGRCRPAAKPEEPGRADAPPVRAAFAYRPPLPRLLHAFKYGACPWLGEALGGWMAGAFRQDPGWADCDALVPVPLHPARLRARGFNQARLLAQELARAARLPLLEGLERTQDTAPQWRFARRLRSQRLLDCFVARTGLKLRGARLVLIDDVCTSGGTLAGCARALREAGASSVRAFVLASAQAEKFLKYGP